MKRLRAWYRARQQRRWDEREATRKIQGLMDLVTWRNNNVTYRQEPGYKEIHKAIDHLIDHWPYEMDWE
jgi:hypothetical protein